MATDTQYVSRKGIFFPDGSAHKLFSETALGGKLGTGWILVGNMLEVGRHYYVMDEHYCYGIIDILEQETMSRSHYTEEGFSEEDVDRVFGDSEQIYLTTYKVRQRFFSNVPCHIESVRGNLVESFIFTKASSGPSGVWVLSEYTDKPVALRKQILGEAGKNLPCGEVKILLGDNPGESYVALLNEKQMGDLLSGKNGIKLPCLNRYGPCGDREKKTLLTGEVKPILSGGLPAAKFTQPNSKDWVVYL
jgi:hypothetical protein